MFEALESVYNNRLKSSFNALKRYQMVPKLRSLDLNTVEKVRKEALKQSKLNESTLYNITKVQSLLLDPALVKKERSVDKRSIDETYSTIQDENYDLISAINFLKSL